MANPSEIVNDPDFINANAATKQAIFAKHVASNPEFLNAPADAQQAIKLRFGFGGAELSAAPTPKPVVVKAVPMGGSAAPAVVPAPDPLVTAFKSMKTSVVTPAAAVSAVAPMPRQANESQKAFDQRMAKAREEADKAAREAAAPKVGDLSAFSAKEQKLKDFEGYLTDYKDELAKNLTVFPTKIPLLTSQGWEIPLPVGADTARMQSKYNALLMGVKDAYQLGALTGPDMGIVEAQIINPASISGMLYSKEAFDEQVKVLEGLLGRAKTNLETSYGRKMAPQPAAPAQGADPLLLRKK